MEIKSTYFDNVRTSYDTPVFKGKGKGGIRVKFSGNPFILIYGSDLSCSTNYPLSSGLRLSLTA